MADLAMSGGDPIQQVRGREVADHGPAPPLAGEQVLVQQHEHLVGAEVVPEVVDDAEPVRVAVGGDAEVCTLIQDRLAQRRERALRGGRHAAAEQRIVAGVDDGDLAAGADEDRLQAGLGHAEHGVQHHGEMGVADGVQIQLLDDRVEIPVDGALLGDQRAVRHLVRGQGAHRRRIQGRDVRGDLVGDLELGIAATLGEHLDAVVQSGVVGGRDRDPVGAALLLHGPHAHRGGDRAGDHGDRHVIAGEHLDRPPGSDVGRKRRS